MKYIKPELEEINLLDPTVFCGISTGTDDPDPFNDQNNVESDDILWD